MTALLIEESEAVDWHNQRIDTGKGEELRAVLMRQKARRIFRINTSAGLADNFSLLDRLDNLSGLSGYAC